jgi:DNA ligase-1
MKPMLAAQADLTKLQYPILASPKLDGVRCLIIGGVAMSRSLKPIPNEWVQDCFARPEFNGLDGELIVGDPNAVNVFQRTTSGVMTADGRPEVRYLVFDDMSHSGPFQMRLKSAAKVIRRHGRGPVELVEHEVMATEARLLAYEETVLAEGFEGVMIRDPNGMYKQGRSTVNEGGLLKLKRFVDSEAEVIGYTHLSHNANEAKLNELGQLERSSHKDGKVALNLLGALSVRDLKSGVEFEIGTGFDADERRLLWLHRNTLKGRLVKYKSQPVGVKDKPRFPVFLGFRDARDL